MKHTPEEIKYRLSNIGEAIGVIALDYITDLEKENAELKEKYVKNITDCDICDTYCNSQFTKAKEIIREFVEWATWQGSNCPNFKSIQDKAEAFLNSEVEK